MPIRRERRPDQAKQPGILLGPVRDRVREPLLVSARGHAKDATHGLHTVPVSMGLDETGTSIGLAPCSASWTSASPFATTRCYRPPNPGNSRGHRRRSLSQLPWRVGHPGNVSPVSQTDRVAYARPTTSQTMPRRRSHSSDTFQTRRHQASPSECGRSDRAMA